MAMEPREREREIIVTNGRNGSGVGAVIAAIVGIVVLGVLIWVFLINNDGDVESPGDVNITEDVDVDVDLTEPAEPTDEGDNT